MATVGTVMRAPLVRRVVYSVGSLVASVISALLLFGDGWLAVPTAVFGVVLLAAVVRVWFLRVEIHPDELVLVNWFRTVRVPWSAVEEFRHDHRSISVRLTDGAEFPMTAFTYYSDQVLPGRGRKLRSVRDHLEAARKAHQ